MNHPSTRLCLMAEFLQVHNSCPQACVLSQLRAHTVDARCHHDVSQKMKTGTCHTPFSIRTDSEVNLLYATTSTQYTPENFGR